MVLASGDLAVKKLERQRTVSGEAQRPAKHPLQLTLG
jgi:hypothetical protein